MCPIAIGVLIEARVQAGRNVGIVDLMVAQALLVVRHRMRDATVPLDHHHRLRDLASLALAPGADHILDLLLAHQIVPEEQT